jgi:hypothetical protein
VGRAADVVLKEGRKLVLVPRETPLSTIHLENMLALSRMGVAMVPPMPAYYNHPQTADDITQHIVTRVLDQFGWSIKRRAAGTGCGRRNIFHRRIKMAFDDLRSFLQALDEQGQLLKIEEEVNAEPIWRRQPTRPAALATARPRCGSTTFAALPMPAW